MYARDASIAGVQDRIVHSHNNGLRNSYTKPFKMILHNMAKKFFSRYITSQLACSAEAANFMFTKGAEWKWIPNGINLDKFCFNEMKRKLMRENLKIKDNTVLIGNVGRLCYQKNQRFLLELFSKVRETCDDFILLLVGSGEDEKALRELAKELAIEDKVVFYGNSNDIVSLYCAMDIFVLPSHFEGLGIVAIEAQAMGLPVICSNYVPKEAMITGLIEVLTIDEGTKPWENKINEMRLRLDRKEVTNEIRNAGYDINSVAQIIQKEWIKNEKPSRSKSS
jgi:glycosyltransferase involved in cell wall biosynthesis